MQTPLRPYAGMRPRVMPVPPSQSASFISYRHEAPPRPLAERAADPAPPLTIDFAAFRAALVEPGGAKAARSYERWLARALRDPAYQAVQDFVHGHRHDALFALTLEEVERVTKDPDPAVRTGHALGTLRPKDDCLKEVDDFDTPWALQYLLHGLLEGTGRLPRWEDFDAYLRGAAEELYYGPFKRRFEYERRTPDEIRRFERALQWRTGNAYYSFLREVDLVVRLRREYGLPVAYHMLADAQFKIDLWCGNVLVAVYIKNERYRAGAHGRKERVGDHLDLAGFHTLDLELDAPLVFGKPSLVTADDVAHAAWAIRAALPTTN